MTKVGTKQIKTLHGPLQPLQRSTTVGLALSMSNGSVGFLGPEHLLTFQCAA